MALLHELTFSHYSPLDKLELFSTHNILKRAMKPFGLWLSVDGEDGWPEWCVSENFRLDTLKHRYAIKLRADGKIKYITNPTELEQFSHDYMGNSPEMQPIPTVYIDWPRLSDEYQGIVISPYIFTMRLYGPLWYYSWDCACGCVWDASAIESVTYVGETDYARAKDNA